MYAQHFTLDALKIEFHFNCFSTVRVRLLYIINSDIKYSDIKHRAKYHINLTSLRWPCYMRYLLAR